MNLHLSTHIILLTLVIWDSQGVTFQIPYQSVNGNSDDKICYTLHTGQLLNQSDAAAECQRHYDGRLVTIFNNSTQYLLDNALRHYNVTEYWTGARLHILDNWVWINNETYTKLEMLQMPDKSPASDWYISVKKIDRYFNKLDKLEAKVIVGTDPSMSSDSWRALCKCSICHGSDRFYTRPARRWHEARNICASQPGTDLAVLVNENLTAVFDMLKKDVHYFIGLSKMQLIWELNGTHFHHGAYTNWYDFDPVNFGKTDCIRVTRTETSGSWRWKTQKCSERRFFICEYSKTDAQIGTDTSGSATPRNTEDTRYLRIAIPVVSTAVLIFAVICIACIVRLKKAGNNVDTVYANIQRPTSSDQTDGCSIYIASPGESNCNQTSKQRPTEVNKIDRVHDGTVYASIVTAADGTQSSMDQTEDNAYEMPVQQVEYASLDFG